MAATTNVTAFVAGLASDVQRIKQDAVVKRSQAVALRALHDLVLQTRVDTGRARGNWDVAVGQPPRAVREATDKAGGVTIARGGQVIQGWDADGVIWIANNVVYIQDLEDLDGMLEGTFQALRTWLDSNPWAGVR
jgi:hypothetical protein